MVVLPLLGLPVNAILKVFLLDFRLLLSLIFNIFQKLP